ncbi:hypothetical protein BJ742DRAFT_739055 [Cladochytrium replicatum]|nr:hypothetical protein BJ742DRAFT_739055 [Cladochytrium replicatum]
MKFGLSRSSTTAGERRRKKLPRLFKDNASSSSTASKELPSFSLPFSSRNRFWSTTSWTSNDEPKRGRDTSRPQSPAYTTGAQLNYIPPIQHVPLPYHRSGSPAPSLNGSRSNSPAPIHRNPSFKYPSISGSVGDHEKAMEIAKALGSVEPFSAMGYHPLSTRKSTNDLQRAYSPSNGQTPLRPRRTMVDLRVAYQTDDSFTAKPPPYSYYPDALQRAKSPARELYESRPGTPDTVISDHGGPTFLKRNKSNPVIPAMIYARQRTQSEPDTSPYSQPPVPAQFHPSLSSPRGNPILVSQQQIDLSAVGRASPMSTPTWDHYENLAGDENAVKSPLGSSPEDAKRFPRRGTPVPTATEGFKSRLLRGSSSTPWLKQDHSSDAIAPAAGKKEKIGKRLQLAAQGMVAPIMTKWS